MKNKPLYITVSIILCIWYFFSSNTFATLWDQNEPAESCYHIKENIPNANNWTYRIQTENMNTPKEMYCDMTTAGGWRMLLFQRRTGRPWIRRENYQNVESCGNNLNDFLHNDCGNPNNVDSNYKQSYSSNVWQTLNEHHFWEYLFAQYAYYWGIDEDNAYIITTQNNLFPDNTNIVNNISYTKICDINGENCDNTDGFWRYVGTSRFASSRCNGSYAWSTTYKGNYGYCHNGTSTSYFSNSLYGDRNWYSETKLWGHPSGSTSWMERVFIRYKDPPPTDIQLSNTTFDHTANTPISIGFFSTTDTSVNDTHTYTFIWTGNDNEDFSIQGNELLLNNKHKSFYTVAIRTTDTNGQYFEKGFIIKREGTNFPWTIENPITSCQWLKANYPNLPSGIYRLKREYMTARKVYCEQEIAEGGRMLLFKRAWWNSNRESCGNKLNEFLHNPCGDLNNLEYQNSYSSDVDKTMQEIGGNEYLVIQKKYGQISEDSYRIVANNSLFPNNDTQLTTIPYDTICDINGENCDNTDGFWLYAGDSRFHSAYCNQTYAWSTQYHGNYGYCHNGTQTSYLASSLYGNRKGYDETKLWGHNTQSATFSEAVYIKDTNYIPPPNTGSVSISSPESITLSYQVKNIPQEYTYNFTGYFKVIDTLWSDTWRYTTISVSNLTNTQWILSSNNIFFKWGAIEKLSGDNNINVVLWPNIQNFYLITTPEIFIKRDTQPNFSLKWTYGSKPQLKFQIPAYQPLWQYQGQLTFTLYEN